ncbi:MAG: valine--tRNA ligase [Elusimicrobia bacterium GWA2_56_46]|nr:MAG: valine--tRNA ligase [Elusimicrobia bacterium GWA2_56_46]OGR54836.1 MAG: valine--tRNA ligase [Elusimicrobia bacterium GWC2_56_31]HBW23372.1 valine--tRNA ligase [Elusimicrobiota bacterium]
MLPKVYDPKPVEAKWSEVWQKEKLFVSTTDKNKKPFVVVIPPPNITGALHMGHALNNSLQDSLVRYERMTGKEAYWVPGTDHGGIATQNVMEKMLRAEGKTREDLGRERFLERMWAWYGECGGTILNQLRKLGCALDTDKDNVRFTMDPQRAKAVFEAFRSLWEKGLLYRDERMINWCTRCETALSDIEVEYEEEKSKLWHIHYPLENGSRGLVVATTRPETMLGDTAVAVNPEDPRYKGLIGKTLLLPLAGRPIPVIGDEEVDTTFGTGAVKVTPAHDPLDFEIGRRHKLETRQVIDFNGKMINCPGKYEDKSVQAARKEVLEDLKAGNFLEKEEHYKHSVNKCYRCNQHIEPLVSEQWFVKMKDLAAPAIAAAEKEEVKFYPVSWKKPFIEWLRNIQDWCVSRQIWWGHRIPVWYCLGCDRDALPYIVGTAGEGGTLLPGSRKGSNPILSMDKPEKCPKCGGHNLIQDPDVLDTWFSSALWPFSVFGWPDKTKELEYYYPTSVLVTGYEILYLWVARMVMSGLEHMGGVPFGRVYVHGIVRDKHGKKMSKSLGNVIDPLTMIDKYGTDAMRFTILSQAIGGKDIPFSEEAIVGGRNFVNKIYNVSRFIQMHLPETPAAPAAAPADLELADEWILERYNKTLEEARLSMEDYDIPKAVGALYGFLWDEFCDWYLELAKPRLETADGKDRVLGLLLHVFGGTLKALHPFMPYVTEEIFSSLKPWLGSDKPFLLKEAYPRSGGASGGTAEADMKKIMDIITQIRMVRAQLEISPAKNITALIASADTSGLGLLQKYPGYITRLAKVEKLEIAAGLSKPRRAVTALSGAFNIYIPVEGVVDLNKERARLAGEIEKLAGELAVSEERLKNVNFISHAPREEVEKITLRKADTGSRLSRLKEIIKDLGS